MHFQPEILPCLKDNFCYLLHDPQSGQTAVVDPGDAAPVLDRLKARGLSLNAILCTHHHPDHVGGNALLLQHFPEATVYGHASDARRIPGLTVGLEHGSSFALGALEFRVLHIPAHTLGAIAYVVEDAVFTGDTLFGAGCGRLFEGTPRQLYTALCQTLMALPDHTRIFFGHEYTVRNLEFALQIEPDSQAVMARLEDTRMALARGLFSTPSTLALEKQTNPFLRVDAPSVLSALQRQGIEGTDPVEVIGLLRQLKDRF